MNKRAPWILVLILFVILMFIVGVRYGQHVEQANKNVSYLLSIAPTKPAPTETPLEFKTYKHKGCALQFLYPSSVSVKNETTASAKLVKGNETLLDFNCTASPSAILKNMEFEKKLNPITGKNIYFIVDKSLRPLLDSSLKF